MVVTCLHFIKITFPNEEWDGMGDGVRGGTGVMVGGRVWGENLYIPKAVPMKLIFIK